MHLTVADIGKTTVPRGWWLYTVSAGTTALYVGQAVDPIPRLKEHFVQPGCIPWRGSALTELAHANWEAAQGWRIELTAVAGDLNVAQAARIRSLRPCLNTQHNPHPSLIPQQLLAAVLIARRQRRDAV